MVLIASRSRRPARAFEQNGRRHVRADPDERQADLGRARAGGAGARQHDAHDAAEAERQAEPFAPGQRLAQQSRRHQRQDQRIGAGDDRADARAPDRG